MNWTITKEIKRKWIDSSYRFTATKTYKGKSYNVFIDWDPSSGNYRLLAYSDGTLTLNYLVAEDDKIEKYGHQLIRMAKGDPDIVFKRVNNRIQDLFLNGYIFMVLDQECKSDLKVKPWWILR